MQSKPFACTMKVERDEGLEILLCCFKDSMHLLKGEKHVTVFWVPIQDNNACYLAQLLSEVMLDDLSEQ